MASPSVEWSGRWTRRRSEGRGPPLGAVCLWKGRRGSTADEGEWGQALRRGLDTLFGVGKWGVSPGGLAPATPLAFPQACCPRPRPG